MLTHKLLCFGRASFFVDILGHLNIILGHLNIAFQRLRRDGTINFVHPLKQRWELMSTPIKNGMGYYVVGPFVWAPLKY